MDTIKAVASYGFAFSVLGAAFYGLVLYPLALDPLVQGALIAWGGAAIAFVFGQEIAKGAAAASQRAYDKGVATPGPTSTTTTTTEGPPASTTVTTGPSSTDPPATGGDA